MRHKIYIAAPSEYWDRAQLIAEALAIELGDADVVSRWHVSPVAKYPDDAEVRAKATQMNVSGLELATVLVALCDAGTPRTTFADIGYALGRGLTVLWVKGSVPSQQCLFDAHMRVIVVEAAPSTAKLVERLAYVIRTRVETAA